MQPSRLLALTLALEQAIDGGRWDEAGALLRSREQAISQSNFEASSGELVAVIEVQTNLMEKLERQKKSLLRELARLNEGKRAVRAYARKPF